MKQVRCAIYTRKSSEEGLEQDFNSLHAQREACAAYVLSQASEGWTALPDAYDDGGLSGGSLERPALKRLLADIEAGRVDIVVVYKVDRLTRSLLDFSKLVEAFDKAGTSFVSVTQSFNTTTSMGRLTLNMLLSFAQFEREVTAERIRDKITASKAKGMWMGGVPPLGYEPDGRTLKIVPEHAALIRRIYDRYLALGNVRLVAEEFERDGTVAPQRTLLTGRCIGGTRFSRGQLYSILRSPIYVGEIPHHGAIHPGLHDPVVDRETWDRVQALLTEHMQGERRRVRAPTSSPLAGKVFDQHGTPLALSHACKGTRRYRYYVGPAVPGQSATRIPGNELEAAVAHCLAEALDDPLGLCDHAKLEFAATGLGQLASTSAALAARARQRDHVALYGLVERVVVHPDRVELRCCVGALASALGTAPAEGTAGSVTLETRVSLRRSGLALRLVQHAGNTVEPIPSQPLVRLLPRARRWWKELQAGDIDVTRLARRERITPSYLVRVLRLAFLSPRIVEAIIAGRTRASVDGTRLVETGAVPLSWSEQERRLLPAAR